MESLKRIAADIYTCLGRGRSEAVYQKAFEVGLRHENISYDDQVPVIIKYLGQPVGIERADLLVNNEIIVELKATKALRSDDRDQLRRYLVDLDRTRGLLVGFGAKLEVEEISC